MEIIWLFGSVGITDASYQFHVAMKTLHLIRSVLFVVMIACFSPGCEKTGAMGPQGEQGKDGPKGAQGDRGAAGEKGAKGDRGNTGPTGAKGDRGDRGDAGSQGPAGPRGAQGARGIANVIYSEWIDPTSLSMASDGRLEIDVPKLTSEILDQGEVYVYLRNPSSSSGAVYLVDGYIHSYWQFRYSVGKGKIWIETVELLASNSDKQADLGLRTLAALLKSVVLSNPGLSSLTWAYSASYVQEADPIMRYEYRYVLVPGGTPGTSVISPTDYRSVSRTFQFEN